jgi:hypothetical protein
MIHRELVREICGAATFDCLHFKTHIQDSQEWVSGKIILQTILACNIKNLGRGFSLSQLVRTRNFLLQKWALLGGRNKLSKTPSIHYLFIFPMIDDPMNCC